MVVAFSVVGLFILLILFSVFLSNRAYEKGVNVKKILLVQVLSFIFSLCSCSALAFAATTAKSNASEVGNVAQASEQTVSAVTAESSKVTDVNAKTLGTGDDSQTAKKSSSAENDSSKGLGFLAMALCMGLGCLGAGIAVAAAAPAAIGAITENEKMFGKVLIFVAMAEGVTVFGLLVAIIIGGRIT